MEIYVVQSGDSIDSIAVKYQLTVDRLAYENQIKPPFRLAVGQALLINDGQGDKEKQPLYVSGYAYPFISPENLQETLVYLSALFVFSYSFTQEGDLLPPESDDARMADAIIRSGVKPILTLTPMTEEGKFSNNLITVLVNHPAVQERLMLQLLLKMMEMGYGGLHMDFEYVLPEDREPYARLIRMLTERFNRFGYEVSVALAPKFSRQQAGLLYEGIDYQLLGAAANRAVIMTYEWGYTYNQTGAG